MFLPRRDLETLFLKPLPPKCCLVTMGTSTLNDVHKRSNIIRESNQGHVQVSRFFSWKKFSRFKCIPWSCFSFSPRYRHQELCLATFRAGSRVGQCHWLASIVPRGGPSLTSSAALIEDTGGRQRGIFCKNVVRIFVVMKYLISAFV